MRRALASLLCVVAMSPVAVVDAGAAQARGERAVHGLPGGTDVDYQLGGEDDVADHVGVVVRDRRAQPAAGVYNVCYVNAFQTQPDEVRFWRRHADLILRHRGRVVRDEAWGERLLDLRTPARRHRLSRIVGRWMDGCGVDGFAAVELDNLDSFTRSRGELDRADALAYARLLVRRAHADGLAVAQKNLAGYDGTRLGFDFAVAESCGRYAECSSYVRSYGADVVMVEYRRADFVRACRAYGATHAIVLRDLALSSSYSPTFC